MESKLKSIESFIAFLGGRRAMMRSFRGSNSGKNMTAIIHANIFNVNNSRLTMNAVKRAMRKEYWGGK